MNMTGINLRSVYFLLFCTFDQLSAERLAVLLKDCEDSQEFKGDREVKKSKISIGSIGSQECPKNVFFFI